MATMPKPIRLQPDTYRRLTEDAARHHEDLNSAAERILRDHLPAGRDRASTLATLDRIARERSSSSARDATSLSDEPPDDAPSRIVIDASALLRCGSVSMVGNPG